VLKIDNLQVTGENNRILSCATFTIRLGQRLCIFGPGGSGKSLLLNFLNGVKSGDLSYSCDFFEINFTDIQLLDFNHRNSHRKPTAYSSDTLLLIDEPENHFEISNFSDFLNRNQQRPTVVFVSHHLDYVQEFADKILVLHYGAFKGIYTKKEFFNSNDPYISYISTMGC